MTEQCGPGEPAIALLHEQPLGRHLHQRKYRCPHCGKRRWGIVAQAERSARLCSRCYVDVVPAVVGDRQLVEADRPAVVAEIRRRAGL